MHFVPVVDLIREPSDIAVRPNGGNKETFHINLPQDRIMAGSSTGGQISAYPAGLVWPDAVGLDGATTEIFKLRNSSDTIVGVAARVSSTGDSSGSFIQWLIHLPARGSIFVRMPLRLSAEGHRNGLMMAGTREFEVLNGEVSEYFNTDIDSSEFDISGRLELVTSLVGPLGEGP